jgi:putative hemolysin
MEDKLDLPLNLPGWLQRPVKSLLGLGRFEEIYARARAGVNEKLSAPEFCKRALDVVGVKFELPLVMLSQFRKIQEPLIIFSNHPFGIVDGMVMVNLLHEICPDFKWIGNAMLQSVPELRAPLIPVEITGPANAGANIGAMRTAIQHLKGGGVLGMFPAGEVSNFQKWTSREAVDTVWSNHLARLMMSSHATAIPVYFSGRNSLLFQYASLISPKARIAILAWEMTRFKGPVRFTIGSPIPHSEVAGLPSAKALTLYLRERCYKLKNYTHEEPGRF